MATSVNGIELRLDASILKGYGELLTLTEGNHIILRAVENDDGRIVLIQIGGYAQRAVFVGGFLFRDTAQQHLFG